MRKPLSNGFSDASAFILTKKLITKLNDIIAKRVLNNLINTEGNLIDKPFLSLTGQLFDFISGIITFELGNHFHHMLYYTHGVFVQREIQEILYCVLEEFVCMN